MTSKNRIDLVLFRSKRGRAPWCKSSCCRRQEGLRTAVVFAKFSVFAGFRQWGIRLTTLQKLTVVILKEGDEKFNLGSCRQFQTKMSDKNFAIDTIGEYCQCNLIDSSTTVKNPTGLRPKECETCEFNYAWCQVLEEFAQLKLSIESLYQNSNDDIETEPVFV